MNAELLWGILSAAVANQGVLELPEELATHPEVAAVLHFLVEQGWLEESHAVGMCVVTPIGRLWVDEVGHSRRLKFHEYGSEVFLLHWQNRETTVWHKGRFATISVEFIPQPEHFEVRVETETVTTAGGYSMGNALATACQLLADDLQVPEPSEPQQLDAHMFDYLLKL